MDSIFDAKGVDKLIRRINTLNVNSQRRWGKMNVAQMMAHCAYAFEDDTPKAGKLTSLFIRLFRKRTVVGEKAYKKNMATAKAFTTLENTYEFEKQKERLIAGIRRIHSLGFEYFDNRKHPVFGRLSGHQWNTFFVKHLDHHLRQFGA